nr:uncharacterized protein LOC113808231 [Penaeus vannamei]
MSGQGKSFWSMPSLDDFSDFTCPSSERPRAKQDKAPKKRDAGDREQKPHLESKSSGVSMPRKQFFGCRAAPSAPPSGPKVRRRCPSYEPDPQLALKRQRDLLSDSEDSDSGDCPRKKGTKVPKGLALPKPKSADPPKGACGASKASFEDLLKGKLPAESHGGQQDGDRTARDAAPAGQKKERKARREQKPLGSKSSGVSMPRTSLGSSQASPPGPCRLWTTFGHHGRVRTEEGGGEPAPPSSTLGMSGQGKSFWSMPSLDDFSDFTCPSSERPRAKQDKAPRSGMLVSRVESKSSGGSKPRKQFFGCRAAPSAPPSGPKVRRRCPSYEPDPQLALKRQRDLLSDSEDSDSGDCPRKKGTKVPKGLALPKPKSADPPKGACGASKASVEDLLKGKLPAESHGGQQDGDRTARERSAKKRDASGRGQKEGRKAQGAEAIR